MRIRKLLFAVAILLTLIMSLTSCAEVVGYIISGITDQSEPEAEEPTVEDIVNEITEDKIRAIVTVKTTFEKGYYAQITRLQTQSSGVIISHEGKTLILTNNHAVTHTDGFILAKVSVVDCFGNEYKAEVYKGRGYYASDSSYDLACLTAPDLTSEVTLNLADANPSVNEKVISLSTPSKQANAITFGEIVRYAPIQVENSDDFVSDVASSVIWHTAKIRQGSSGGALVNYDLELVGINFAGNKTADNEFTDGFSIPVDLIRDFLNDYT